MHLLYYHRLLALVACVTASLTARSNSPLQVDLGYSVYQGYSASGLRVFLGIRYASAPVGHLRWQPPQSPLVNRSTVIPAQNYGPQCPQSVAHTATALPSNNSESNEDCLFINVYTPSNAASPLPVLVFIHGGGYGSGNGQYNLTSIINKNGNSFVGVTIQYRLGAFGFLSSDEVFRKGVVNAGLLDQNFALQWVQQYIHLFGGDPTRVTISGQSAGAGSVMLHAMAYGGTLGTTLFQNSIAASPYLPTQYGYKDWIPSQSYYAFANAVGCNTAPYLANGSLPIFECLQAAESSILINASATVVSAGSYGTWAFLPVTDGTFIQDLPSRQLASNRLNGESALVGNDANEGYLFTPQDIITESDLLHWLSTTYPLLSELDIALLLDYYPSINASSSPNAMLFATAGDSGPTALNQSSVGTGQQQRAYNIYAEATFVCPSYWLAAAYSQPGKNGGFKYQFSIPPALHGFELVGFLVYPDLFYTTDFETAFSQIWGNFVTRSNPSISNFVANGVSTGNATANPASAWPIFNDSTSWQIDLNTTCTQNLPLPLGIVNSTICIGAQNTNTFRLVDANTWEGGRGARCNFWKMMGESVPG